MYQSFLNIKHLNRSHLYWGIDKDTGDVVDIDEVSVRGLSCNCRCAACKGDFIARKGEKNKHHFAHQSNYECVYANEIAIYLMAKRMLEQSGTIQMPSVPVKIGKRTELAKESWAASIGEVHFQCEPEQYPPLLVAVVDNQPTRIILSFGKYYNSEDQELLRREARAESWDCLSIPLPRINDKDSINPIMLHNSLLRCVEEKSWFRNARSDRWKLRLEEAAQKPPQTLPTAWGTTYDCPIHSQHRDGKYYARPQDCEHCSYNLSTYPECKCLAFKPRAVMLAPQSLELLNKWHTEQLRLRILNGDRWVRSDFIFTHDDGTVMNPDSITSWLRKFSERHNLPHIHPHAFRHTAASTMIANGVDLVTAASELGHANATTTANIYAHQIAVAKARAAKVRGGVFSTREQPAKKKKKA